MFANGRSLPEAQLSEIKPPPAPDSPSLDHAASSRPNPTTASAAAAAAPHNPVCFPDIRAQAERTPHSESTTPSSPKGRKGDATADTDKGRRDDATADTGKGRRGDATADVGLMSLSLAAAAASLRKSSSSTSKSKSQSPTRLPRDRDEKSTLRSRSKSSNAEVRSNGTRLPNGVDDPPPNGGLKADGKSKVANSHSNAKHRAGPSPIECPVCHVTCSSRGNLTVHLRCVVGVLHN